MSDSDEFQFTDDDELRPAPSVGGVPENTENPGLWKQVVRGELWYALAGLGFGVVCILAGVVLFFHGVGGSTSWTASALGLESTINDAAPGTVLFVVGLFVVFVTRYRVKAQ